MATTRAFFATFSLTTLSLSPTQCKSRPRRGDEDDGLTRLLSVTRIINETRLSHTRTFTQISRERWIDKQSPLW